jgi:hypothetical protein
MPHRNRPSPGHDTDGQSGGSAWRDRRDADQPWAEQQATSADPVSGASNLAGFIHPRQAQVGNGHLARLAEALHESRRRQAPQASRDHLRLVREACEQPD